jgi:hypothetical protein
MNPDGIAMNPVRVKTIKIWKHPQTGYQNVTGALQILSLLYPHVAQPFTALLRGEEVGSFMNKPQHEAFNTIWDF